VEQVTEVVQEPAAQILFYGLNTGCLFSLNATIPSLASGVPQKKVNISTPISALEESKS
jgi:hypothetical protein